MDTLTRRYESTIIINATLDDAQTEAVIARIQEVLAKNGAIEVTVEKWGRKRLAYPIQKKNNGFYVVFLFTAKGDTVARLERQYQLDENVIRYLTVQLDAKAITARRSVARSEEEPAVPAPVSVPVPVPASAPQEVPAGQAPAESRTVAAPEK